MSRYVAALALGSCVWLVGAGLAACASDTEGGSTPDGSTGTDTGGGEEDTDGGPTIEAGGDAGTGDAARDANGRDANGPGEAGSTCSFNADCMAALRCECDLVNGCACAAGARGVGRNGVDPCVDGNDCESAVCVEGPTDAGFFCSDECTTSADCAGKLPLCSSIAFVGRICIRNGP